MNIFYSKIKVKQEHYLSNCYKRLTRSKIIHFLFLLIEILLILIVKLDIFNRKFEPRTKIEGKIIINPIILLINKIDSLPTYIIFLITIIPIIIFDFFYLLLCKYYIKSENKFFKIIINFFELFYFRLYTILFYSLLFSLTKLYFTFASIISIFHTYLMIFNLMQNHLYFCVPEFINYPYDEFSSRYDLYLFLSKIILSFSSVTKNGEFSKFLFYIDIILQAFYCYYFINKILFHSYLLMNNPFINKSKLSLFFGKTTILIISYIFKDKNLFTIFYYVLCFDIILIYMGIMFFIYDPFSHIRIRNQSPLKNIYFYINTINKRKDIEFLIENKIINHYKECGFCHLCQNYIKYKREYTDNNINIKDNENEDDYLIDNKNNKLFDLFKIINSGEKKYFDFIIKVIINYKKFGQKFFFNNPFYYINLLNLIYLDYSNNDVVLSLNEKIIFEIINEENNLIIEKQQIQINQLVLYNEFINIVKNILNLLKEILYCSKNFLKIQKLVILSKLLKKLKKREFKKYIFNRKLKNVCNSKNLLLSCSILYEEILNTTLNQNRIQIREDLEVLEDFTENYGEKNYITLKFNLINNNCEIIRAGKDLFTYLNYNLYDLFPYILKEYQINLFINLVLNGFHDKVENNNDKKEFNKNIIFKNDYIEIKIILQEIISNKTLLKVVNLKLTSLFNNEFDHFIILNGSYYFNRNTIISIVDLNHRKEFNEKIIGYSNLWIESSFKKKFFSINNYDPERPNFGYKMTKIFSFQISFNLFNIYNLKAKNTLVMKRKSQFVNFNKLLNKNNDSEDEGDKNFEEYKEKNLKLNEHFNSITSVTTSGNKIIFSRDKAKIKKYNINEFYNNLGKLRKIIYAYIIVIILIILFEYFYFYIIQEQEYNIDKSFTNFEIFLQLYYQLFTSILSVACVPEKKDSKKCRNIIDIFNDFYSSINPKENFNFNEYILVQNKILAQKLMDEKSNYIKIRDYIGEKIYDKLFYKEIKYVEISKGATFNVNEITLRLFDAILIICNSFRVLTEYSNYTQEEPIYFLNRSENPFINLDNQNEMSSYQEEVYKMILNFKYISPEITYINDQLIQIIEPKSILLRFTIIFYLNLNIFLFLIIIILNYYYLIYFNKIIIRILDYVLKEINIKDDDFEFCETFTKKIENLESLLEIYKVNPLESINNLNSLYEKYKQYLNKNNSNNNLIINIIENEKDEKDLQKSQIEVTRKNISKLNINKKYILYFLLFIFLFLIIYILFLFTWIDFFIIKRKLTEIIEKYSRVEKTSFEAINLYFLMIFNNYTINEIDYYLKFESINKRGNIDNSSNFIFNYFYNNLYYLFDLTKDKKQIKNLYQTFEDSSEFNCTSLYTSTKHEILEEISNILYEKDIKKHLINICRKVYITEANDMKTIFERHFQYIKNGILSLTDFSFEGLNKNLNSTIPSKISIYFLTTTIYIIETITTKPHKNSMKKINYILNITFLTMELVFIIFAIVLILINCFFYFYNINEFCKQIFLLIKTFNIYKIYE